MWSKKCEWIENPLADSTQMDEAFIGVVSRISRRVSPASTVRRTIDVYLTMVQKHLHKTVLDWNEEVVWGKDKGGENREPGESVRIYCRCEKYPEKFKKCWNSKKSFVFSTGVGIPAFLAQLVYNIYTVYLLLLQVLNLWIKHQIASSFM